MNIEGACHPVISVCPFNTLVFSPQQIPGTAEMARSKVQHYFRELHEALQRQKEVAMSVVDTHVRERLYMLRQQQEDITAMMSNVSSMCVDCERRMQQVIGPGGGEGVLS